MRRVPATRGSRFRGTALVSLLLGVAFAGSIAEPAEAYIDAGTGGLLIQLLLAGVAGAVVLTKLYWQKLKGFFTRSGK